MSYLGRMRIGHCRIRESTPESCESSIAALKATTGTSQIEPKIGVVLGDFGRFLSHLGVGDEYLAARI